MGDSGGWFCQISGPASLVGGALPPPLPGASWSALPGLLELGHMTHSRNTHPIIPESFLDSTDAV